MVSRRVSGNDDVPLLHIALDGRLRPELGILGIEPGSPTSPPLPEEVPALVKGDLEPSQLVGLLGVQSFAGVALLQPVLLGH